ncbi:MAG TPA: hypothetical protein VHQ39_00745, partial [Dongiaceae bacterium]|nr:hypothetical protein [Dongiaceae bacterium]
MDLKNFDLGHWWKLTAAAGALIAVASATAGFAAGFLVGVGLLLFGVGEWISHPQVQRPVPNAYRPLGIVTTHERNPMMLGFALDVI